MLFLDPGISDAQFRRSIPDSVGQCKLVFAMDFSELERRIGSSLDLDERSSMTSGDRKVIATLHADSLNPAQATGASCLGGSPTDDFPAGRLRTPEGCLPHSTG